MCSGNSTSIATAMTVTTALSQVRLKSGSSAGRSSNPGYSRKTPKQSPAKDPQNETHRHRVNKPVQKKVGEGSMGDRRHYSGREKGPANHTEGQGLVAAPKLRDAANTSTQNTSGHSPEAYDAAVMEPNRNHTSHQDLLARKWTAPGVLATAKCVAVMSVAAFVGGPIAVPFAGMACLIDGIDGKQAPAPKSSSPAMTTQDALASKSNVGANLIEVMKREDFRTSFDLRLYPYISGAPVIVLYGESHDQLEVSASLLGFLVNLADQVKSPLSMLVEGQPWCSHLAARYPGAVSCQNWDTTESSQKLYQAREDFHKSLLDICRTLSLEGTPHLKAQAQKILGHHQQVSSSLQGINYHLPDHVVELLNTKDYKTWQTQRSQLGGDHLSWNFVDKKKQFDSAGMKFGSVRDEGLFKQVSSFLEKHSSTDRTLVVESGAHHTETLVKRLIREGVKVNPMVVYSKETTKLLKQEHSRTQAPRKSKTEL